MTNCLRLPNYMLQSFNAPLTYINYNAPFTYINYNAPSTYINF